jgi:hypothetical protein
VRGNPPRRNGLVLNVAGRDGLLSGGRSVVGIWGIVTEIESVASIFRKLSGRKFVLLQILLVKGIVRLLSIV